MGPSMKSKLTAALVSCVICISPAFARVVYTATNGPTCTDQSKPEFGDWTCPGPGGYVARFTDEGNLAAVSIAGPRAKKRTATSQFLGAGRVFGDKIEWHVTDGAPKSAVLRIWRREQMRDGSERELQELEIYALNPGLTCPYATVNVTEPDANAKAAAHAEEAMRWQCTER